MKPASSRVVAISLYSAPSSIPLRKRVGQRESLRKRRGQEMRGLRAAQDTPPLPCPWELRPLGPSAEAATAAEFPRTMPIPSPPKPPRQSSAADAPWGTGAHRPLLPARLAIAHAAPLPRHATRPGRRAQRPPAPPAPRAVSGLRRRGKARRGPPAQRPSRTPPLRAAAAAEPARPGRSGRAPYPPPPL